MGRDGATGGSRGKIDGFRARDFVADRKMIKVMSRSVQLGVAAIQMALDDVESWQAAPAPRRAMYVGTTPLGGDAQDLIPALEASMDASGGLSMEAFATKGYERIHPLWLIRGLSNNILGLAASIHDFQGVNANYCSGDKSGLIALVEAYWAVAEGRADLAVAGGADAMVEFAEQWMDGAGGEGAAFFVLRAAQTTDPWSVKIRTSGPEELAGVDESEKLGYLGAAGDVVALARAAFSSGKTSIALENGMKLEIFG